MLVWWEWLSFTGWLGLVISVAMRPTIHIAPSEENFWAFQDTRLPLHYDYSCKLLRGRLSLDLDSRLVSFIVGWLFWYWELDPEPWACQAEPLSLHPSHVPNPGLTSLRYRCAASHWTRHKLKISILAAYRVSWELRSTAKRGKHVMKLSAHGFTARGHPFGITCWAVWHLKGLQYKVQLSVPRCTGEGAGKLPPTLAEGPLGCQDHQPEEKELKTFKIVSDNLFLARVSLRNFAKLKDWEVRGGWENSTLMFIQGME